MTIDVCVTSYDAELGRFHTVIWQPPMQHELVAVIDRIWYFDGILTHRRERVFPNGLIELIVQLDQPHRPVDDVAGDPFPAACVGGLQRYSAVVEAPAGRIRVLGVRMHPAAVRSVLHWQPRDICDRTVDLSQVAGPAAHELAARCAEAGDGAACVRIAASWVRQRYAAGSGLDPRVAWSIAHLRGDAPATIGTLRDAMGLAASRFNELFNVHVGVSPKRYARIARFQRALRAVHHGASFADVAAGYGFADQSHFAAEFRAHAGMTPGQYVGAARYREGSLAEPATAIFS